MKESLEFLRENIYNFLKTSEKIVNQKIPVEQMSSEDVQSLAKTIENIDTYSQQMLREQCGENLQYNLALIQNFVKEPFAVKDIPKQVSLSEAAFSVREQNEKPLRTIFTAWIDFYAMYEVFSEDLKQIYEELAA